MLDYINHIMEKKLEAVEKWFIRDLKNTVKRVEIRKERDGQQKLPRERFVCLVGLLTSSATTRLYRGRAPRQRLTIFTCCHT